MTEGVVSFYDEKTSSQGSGPLGAAGKYEIENLPTGNYVVTVFPVPASTTMDASGKAPVTPDPENIPKNVRGGKTSPLRAEIKAGSNTHDFELKTP